MEEFFVKKYFFSSVFSDVPTAFETWAKTHKIAIYSTGSVDAQKLLFAHTINGDLTAHISGFYDQKTGGAKTESKSYETIAKDLGFKPEEIIFITDDVNGNFQKKIFCLCFFF